MSLFSIKSGDLEEINKVTFKLEREIHELISKNLRKIFNLDFVKNEFKVNDLRIDTLSFNDETKSFVIIEYKKDKNLSVIDQGYAYLSLLLNNKADFILEYNESKDNYLKRDDVDWSQSRVIFVSPQFTKYQRKAIGFKDLPFELWEVNKYDNGIILFNQLKSPETSASIEEISKENEIVRKVNQEVKVYDEDYHLKETSEEINELYAELKGRILNLNENIEIKYLKYYIAFVSRTNFADLHIYKSHITMWLNLRKGTLDDPKRITRDVSSTGKWGNGDYEIKIKPESDLDYIITLIKQSYKQNS